MTDKHRNTTQWDLASHQQNGFVRLWSSALNAYMDLLRISFALYCIPFSFFQTEGNAAEAVIRKAQHSAKEVTQRANEAATQQVKQLAEQATLPVAEAAGRETATNTEEESSLHLHEEQLQVHKQSVQTGKVRLGKEVVTEQKTINVPVTREEMIIEHRPASGQVTETSIGEGETIRIPISEEQVNITKQTVETGEVALGKRQVQETQQVSDAVRREEARFEVEGKVNIQESDLNELTQQPKHEKKQS